MPVWASVHVALPVGSSSAISSSSTSGFSSLCLQMVAHHSAAYSPRAVRLFPGFLLQAGQSPSMSSPKSDGSHSRGCFPARVGTCECLLVFSASVEDFRESAAKYDRQHMYWSRCVNTPFQTSWVPFGGGPVLHDTVCSFQLSHVMSAEVTVMGCNVKHIVYSRVPYPRRIF